MLQPVTGRANATVSYVTVTWQSVAGTSYFIERSTNLTSSAVFTPVITDWPGQPNTTTFMDITVGAGPFFYRVASPLLEYGRDYETEWWAG